MGWLTESFEAPEALSARGAWHLYRCRQATTGSWLAVVIGRPDRDAAEVAGRLEAMAELHASSAHPAVARVIERGQVGEVAFLAFATRGEAPLAGLLSAASERNEPLPGALAAVVRADLHELPVSLISASALLVDRSGRLSLVGLGPDGDIVGPGARTVDELAAQLDALTKGRTGAEGEARAWLGEAAAQWRPVARSEATARLQPQELVAGRYRVERALGGGRRSSVYLGWDRVLRQDVALKVMQGADAEARERSIREARLLRTTHHPHLLRGWDVVDDGRLVMVMAYVSGVAITRWLDEQPSERAEVARILADVTDALAHLHALGVVHRDIEPSSVLIQADGRPMLIGLGSVGIDSGVPLTRTGELFGRAAYLAPELLQGGRATPASDVYALAALASEVMGSRDHPAVARALRERPELRPSASELAEGLRAETPAPAEPVASGAALTVGPDARWFQVADEAPVDLSRRGPIRRLLEAVVEATEPLDVYDLLDAGWPGQNIDPEAGARRVYVAVSELRKLGLKDLLRLQDDGYVLDRTASVVRSGGEAPR